jgi:polysaccharide deacetylase family protein (PEP-CTERM system associated)
MARVLNALSVDVEDWFQVQAFAGVIAREAWDGLDRRVEANTDRVLDLFAAAGTRATFFTLGWVAERHPALVRRIVVAGHELASHGHGHELVHAIGPEKFRTDISRAKAVLEDATGIAVHGYRAPTFSIAPRIAPWAHAVLAETGHSYSSSVFPVRHDLYGAPDAPRVPWRPDPNGVLELPMTTVRIGSRNLPCSGGGWFRMFPYAMFRAGLARVNTQEKLRGIFYFHPWEIDPAQPRVAHAPARSRLRHYSGLPGMHGKLERLLRDFAWDRVDAVFPEVAPAPTLNTAPNTVLAA